MRSRPLILLLGFCLVGLGGYWLARTAVPDPEPKASSAAAAPRAPVAEMGPDPRLRRERPLRTRDDEAHEAGAIPGQRSIVFKDRAAMERFLARAGDGIAILGRLDALNALRVAFPNADDLAGLLDGDEETSMIFPVLLPEDEAVGAQAGAVPLGNGLLEWMGITGDNSDWGTGVLIAILDTGIVAHPAFASQIQRIDLVSPGSDPSTWHPHGTAVVSPIIGDHPRTPGIAPGADILDVRVADANGYSDSFTLAQGIIAAADAGASIINISLGSNGKSSLVENALAYAASKGAVVLAAAGNGGREQVSQPAGSEGVISVGGVDARGNHVAFSNSGKVDIAAPAYGVNVAWPGDSSAAVDGTSFSTPMIAGAVAAAMTHSGSGMLGAYPAMEMVMSHANEAGVPGKDPWLGVGFPAMDRVMNAGEPNRYDAAVASHHVIPPSATTPYPQLQVVVQNRGTEILHNTGVRVETPVGAVEANIPTLRPNGIHAVNIPLSRVAYDREEPMRFDSTVRLAPGRQDINTNNDRRVDIYTPSPAP